MAQEHSTAVAAEITVAADIEAGSTVAAVEDRPAVALHIMASIRTMPLTGL